MTDYLQGAEYSDFMPELDEVEEMCCEPDFEELRQDELQDIANSFSGIDW